MMAVANFDMEFPDSSDAEEGHGDYLESAEPPPAKKARYASRSTEDIEALIDQRTPNSTKKTRSVWVNVFRDYCRANWLAIDLTTDPPAKIAAALVQCYVNVRTKDGKAYQKASLKGLRAALQCEIRGSRPSMNIITDPEFNRANAALDARLKEMMRSGESRPAQHKEVIVDSDMRKLGRYFDDTHDSVVLTEAVWFAITYHFALRGCENQAKLTRHDLVLKTDENGDEYVELATALATKNHQGGCAGREKVSDGRIQHPEQVAAVKLLLERLNPKCDCLFQMATRGVRASRDGAYYSGLPLGHGTIQQMMKRISQKAGLSRSYTNHCVRASAIQRLVDAGISETSIIATTGHKQVQSITAYASRNSEARKKEIAAVLDGDGHAQSVVLPPPPRPTTTRRSLPRSQPQVSSVASAPKPLGPQQHQRHAEQDRALLDDIDEFIATCDLDQVCSGRTNSDFDRVCSGRNPVDRIQSLKSVNWANANVSFGANSTIHLHF